MDRPARRTVTLLAALVIGLSGALVASTLASVVYGTGVDEGHYVTYARIVESQGLTGFVDFFRDYVGDPERWRYPNPLRLGYIATAGLCVSLAEDDFAALSWLSLLCHLATLTASWLYARRLLGEPRALLLLALLACSPLWLGLARRALLDSFATLWAVLALWTFLDAVRVPDDRRRLLACGGAFALALLGKETNVLLLVPFALFLGWERAVRGAQTPLVPLAAALGGGLAAAGLVWVVVAGGPGTLLSLVGIILRSPETNVYANTFGKGPWVRYVVDFALLSPAVTLLAVGGLAGVASGRGGGGTRQTLVLFALTAVALLVAYDFFTKNVRYVAALDLPLRVLASACLWELFREGRTAALRAGCVVAVLGLCALDVASFRFLFVASGLYDPVSAALLALREMIPPL